VSAMALAANLPQKKYINCPRHELVAWNPCFQVEIGGIGEHFTRSFPQKNINQDYYSRKIIVFPDLKFVQHTATTLRDFASKY
jgi:hypothetical protein